MTPMSYLRLVPPLALVTLIFGLSTGTSSAQSSVVCQRKLTECINSCPLGVPASQGKHSPACVDRCEIKKSICNSTFDTHGPIRGSSETEKRK
jgi:hypothetical protein